MISVYHTCSICACVIDMCMHIHNSNVLYIYIHIICNIYILYICTLYVFVLPDDSPFLMFLATSTRSIEHHPTEQVYRLFINIGQLLFDGPPAILCQRWWWKPPKSSQIYRFGESTTCWPCPCGWNSQRWGLGWRVEGQACNMVDVCRHESCWISFLWQLFFRNMLDTSVKPSGDVLFCIVMGFHYMIWQSRRFWFDLLIPHVPPFRFSKAANHSTNLQDLTTVSVPSSCVGATAQMYRAAPVMPLCLFVFLVWCVYWRFPVTVL